MIKRDCYFCSEWHDMNATMEACEYSGDLEDSKSWCLRDDDCENCSFYVSKQDVDEIVRDYIKNNQ